MRRSAILGAATVAALAAGTLAVTSGQGSSHREAPGILGDPQADNTDLYAFTAPDAPGSLTIVSNWIPFEDPSSGPYFGKLDPKARYYVKIDNTGDGREDVAYRWQFKQRFRRPGSFLYAAPTVDSVDDPDLNFVQTYDLYRETYRKGRKLGARRIEDVRRPVRRPVLHRPGRDVRRDQHRQAGPPRHRAGQPGRRQGRRRRLQHPRVRAAGARSRRDAQPQARDGA